MDFKQELLPVLRRLSPESLFGAHASLRAEGGVRLLEDQGASGHRSGEVEARLLMLSGSRSSPTATFLSIHHWTSTKQCGKSPRHRRRIQSIFHVIETHSCGSATRSVCLHALRQSAYSLQLCSKARHLVFDPCHCGVRMKMPVICRTLPEGRDPSA